MSKNALQGFWRAHKADMHIVEAVHFAKRKEENVAVPTYSAKAKVPRKTRQNHQPHAPWTPCPWQMPPRVVLLSFFDYDDLQHT